MRISVVTPSFNQAAFIEDTIESVLGQGHPDTEYLVLDGGSDDGSADIIRSYENHLAFWTSAPDGGQASAINEGFDRATGDVLSWLNSDDFYLPGSLAFVSDLLEHEDGPVVLFGNAIHFNTEAHQSWGSDVCNAHRQDDIAWIDYIVQPSTFWTRAAWDLVGPLNVSMNWTFDWDWFIRAQRAGVRFLSTERFLSAYRIHAEHKTGTGGARRQAEIAALYEKYHSPEVADLFRMLAGPEGMANRTRRFSQKSRLYKLASAERVLWSLYGRKFPYRAFRGLVLTAESS